MLCVVDVIFQRDRALKARQELPPCLSKGKLVENDANGN